MRTHIDCVPCFFKQAMETARLSGACNDLQKKIMDEVALALPGFPLSSSPPEMGRIIHSIIKEHTGVQDPYSEIKKRSNELALALYGKFKKKAETSDDGLLAAVELAIAGNIIDYGVNGEVNVEAELDRILKEERGTVLREGNIFFDYKGFTGALEKARNVLYLGDNAGEVVFDRILIEEINKKNVPVDYVVKERPIINDALTEDAVFCGVDRAANVLSSGCDVPGTILSLCTEEFRQKFLAADMVISKGQGNFETLYPPVRPVFFLFMAKCPVVAGEIGCPLREVLLLSGLPKDQNAAGYLPQERI